MTDAPPMSVGFPGTVRKLPVPVRRIVYVAGLVLVPIGLFVAACASAGSNPPAASAQPGANAYLSCLSSNGVTLPSGLADRTFGPRGSGRPSGFPTARPSGSGRNFPGGGFGGFGGFGTQAPPGVDQATWDKAQQACAALRPTARPTGGGNGGNSALRAYRNCLAQHGVTATAGPLNLNTADPTVAAAMQACAPLRPTGGPGPAGTG